jgi:hypothetical protein
MIKDLSLHIKSTDMEYKDDKYEIAGVVTEVRRGSPIGKSSTIVLNITDEKLEKYEALFPHPTQSEPDLTPMKLGLEGCRVRYTIRLGRSRENRLPGPMYVLEVFSGPLRGKLYEANLQY